MRFGHSISQGSSHLKRGETILDEPNSDLSALSRKECQYLLTQISDISSRIDIHTKTAKRLSEETNKARRLQTMPSIGPITAFAIEAFALEMANFRRGRDFAAWLGLASNTAFENGLVLLRLYLTKAGYMVQP
ncbi:transposase [Brucella pseudogrignonensis]|uniref:transposase n=1 Tax=Brucella pseudogrignonensis TaxID=419475 RepID=UPI00391B5E8F